jgi:large subunit ribosomal protein L23
MKDIYRVIVRPIITEKSTLQRETNNKVTFEVNPSANKKEIKEAIERIFKVTVLDVRTMRRQGKPKRVGRNVGRTRDWKKAIATLKPGDHIEFFEGV